eukprot:33798-Eustigmatos_ZCMA.PRE.1
MEKDSLFAEGRGPWDGRLGMDEGRAVERTVDVSESDDPPVTHRRLNGVRLQRDFWSEDMVCERALREVFL